MIKHLKNRHAVTTYGAAASKVLHTSAWISIKHSVLLESKHYDEGLTADTRSLNVMQAEVLLLHSCAPRHKYFMFSSTSERSVLLCKARASEFCG